MCCCRQIGFSRRGLPGLGGMVESRANTRYQRIALFRVPIAAVPEDHKPIIHFTIPPSIWSLSDAECDALALPGSSC
jgi:hypothetical protein